MIMNQLIRNAPVIGQVASFATTAKSVYNCTTISGACVTACKGIILDCTPPIIKYPALCAGLGVSGVVCIVTGGNPFATQATICFAESIVEQISG